MERGRKQSFVKYSPLFEVDLKKSDSYHQVIMKVARVVDLDEEGEKIVLLTSKGVIINNSPITTSSQKEVTWTLGAYLLKRHISADKLALDVAVAAVEEVPSKIFKADYQTKSKPSMCNYPKEATDGDIIKGAW